VLAPIVSVTVPDPLPLTVEPLIQLSEETTTHEQPDVSVSVTVRDPPPAGTDAVLLSVAVSHCRRVRHMPAVAVPPARSDEKYRFCVSALTEGWLSIPAVLTAPKFIAGPNDPVFVSRVVTQMSAPPLPPARSDSK